jgi:hypothetical protein
VRHPLLLVLPALALAACVDPLEIDPGTRITCESDDDCPPGWSCRDIAGDERCVDPASAADVTPPALTGAEVPEVVRGDFQVTLTFDEPVAALAVTFAGEPVAVDAGEASFTLDLPVAGLERGAPHALSLESAADAVGNAIPEPVLLGEVVVDDVAPTIVTEARSYDGAFLKRGEAATVTLTFDEPVVDALDPSQGPRVVATVGDEELDLAVVRSGTTHAFSLAIDDARVDGAYTVALAAFADAAGNEAAAAALGGFTVDTIAPQLIEVGDPRCALDEFIDYRLGSGQPVTFDFCLDDPAVLASQIQILLGGEAGGTLTPLDGVPGGWSFSGDPPLGGQAAFAVELRAFDAAENVAPALVGFVNFDGAAPEVASMFWSPATAPANLQSVQISITASEPIASMTPVFDPARVASVVSLDGTTGVFEVPAPVQGLRVASIALVDLAQNPADLDDGDEYTSAVLNVDELPPVIEDFELLCGEPLAPCERVSHNEGFQDFVVQFRLTENDAIAPEVRVGDELIPFDTCAPSATPGLTDCPFRVEDLGQVGTQIVFVEVLAFDQVGNFEVDARTILFDFDGPALVGQPSYVIRSPNALIGQTTVAKEGAEIEVATLVTEPLSSVRARIPEGAGAFLDACQDSQDLLVRCGTRAAGRLFFPNTIPLNGTSAVELELIDSVGNASTVTAGAFPYDLEAPPNPIAAALTYTRAPWGRLDGKIAEFSVSGERDQVFPTDPELRLFLFDKLDDGALIGADDRALQNIQIDLGLIDRPEVFAKAVDAAGNESSVGLLTNATWYATLIGKVAGSSVPNPHQVFAVPHADDATELDVFATGATELSLPNANDDVSYKPRWRFLASDAPPVRRDPAVAWDAGRRRAVVFGGSTAASSSLLADTWEWDGRSFEQSTAIGPPERSQHAMAYDARAAKVVLFGGQGLSGALADTWRYDGVRWTAPRTFGVIDARRSHGMAYDRTAGVMVVHGGRDGSDLRADTCELVDDLWDCAVRPGSPAAGEVEYMASAPDGDGVILVEHTGLRRTLRYRDGAWSPVAGSPAADLGAGHLVEDPFTRSLILFETAGPRRIFRLADVGGNWEQLFATVPTGVFGVAGASGGDDVLLLGETFGDSGVGTWTGTQLLPLSFARPFPRSDAAFAQAQDIDELLIFGGDGGALLLQDTWVLERAGFRQLTSIPPGLTPRRHAALARLDDGTHVLFGGEHLLNQGGGPVEEQGPEPVDDTWVLSNENWAERLLPLSPPPRFDHAMASFDGTSVVLYGGDGNPAGPFGGSTFFDDTWIFDGAAWSVRLLFGPGNRTASSMAPGADGAFMFGGIVEAGPIGDDDGLWTFDGAGWTSVGSRASARSGHALVHDGAELLVVGGAVNIPEQLASADNPVPDNSFFDVAGAPLSRTGAAVGMVNGELHLFGGKIGTSITDDLFVLEGMDGGVPVIQYVIDVGQARLDVGFVVDRGDLSVTIGGVSGLQAGARLEVWNHQLLAWEQLASNSSGLAGAATEVTAPLGREHLTADRVHVRVRPLTRVPRGVPNTAHAHRLELALELRSQ